MLQTDQEWARAAWAATLERVLKVVAFEYMQRIADLWE